MLITVGLSLCISKCFVLRLQVVDVNSSNVSDATKIVNKINSNAITNSIISNIKEIFS